MAMSEQEMRSRAMQDQVWKEAEEELHNLKLIAHGGHCSPRFAQWMACVMAGEVIFRRAEVAKAGQQPNT